MTCANYIANPEPTPIDNVWIYVAIAVIVIIGVVYMGKK